jgi:SAM-dependent methyltransferase
MLVSRIDMRVRQNIPLPMRRAIAAGSDFFCPVCESEVSAFRDFGHLKAVWCPVCLAMDRHRLVWRFFQTHTDLFSGTPKRMLHVAPEVAFEPRFRQAPGLDYLTADLVDPKVDVRMDITDIQYPDSSFDVVYCSHVLEHVPDDRKAMQEFRRVLRPNGWTVLMVPTGEDHTIEDPTCNSAAERERRFGQHDHFRRYGPDFAQRLTDAGFEVTALAAPEILQPEERRRLAVPDTEIVFFGRPR